MKQNNYEERELVNTFDVLEGFFKNLPKATTKWIDIKRYQLMLKTAADLKNLLCKTMSEGCIDIEVNKGFNLGSITMEMTDLSICEPEAFATIISNADNFEIYPLANGNMRMDISFQAVMKPNK